MSGRTGRAGVGSGDGSALRRAVRRRLLVLPLVLAGACVYFNAMYDAGQAYDAGLRATREGRGSEARRQFDSVIAKAGRVLENHPGSKYADDAALLKARSEVQNEQWEAAGATALLARRLAASAEDSAVAVGLAGIARLFLEDPSEADTYLSRALEGPVRGDDRAMFLFHRGLARIELDRPAEAAEDLQAAAEQIDLTPIARLGLARALRDVGELERSAAVTAALLAAPDYAEVATGATPHVDSLVEAAPAPLAREVAAVLEDPAHPPAKRSLLHYVRGSALARLDSSAAALTALDSAAAVRTASRSAPEAALLASRLRLRAATTPADVQATVEPLAQARSVVDPEERARARALADAARRFDALTSAWQSRGSAAAEAALRAGEIAGVQLGAPAVARGLYLKYLELAPGSRWEAKALAAALLYAGHRPGDWVRDEGEATDARLRARLAALPADDPYRVALEARPGDVFTDSAYVLAEADLRDRILEIQMIFDTTVVRVRRDSVPATPPPADTARQTRDGREVEF
ncbi:MAG: hypothetical protein RRA92_07735 [Gemmatimonadota bacterium]|nr:hypothetical protein [Gemmatimonadota bacterium]